MIRLIIGSPDAAEEVNGYLLAVERAGFFLNKRSLCRCSRITGIHENHIACGGCTSGENAEAWFTFMVDKHHISWAKA